MRLNCRIAHFAVSCRYIYINIIPEEQLFSSEFSISFKNVFRYKCVPQQKPYEKPLNFTRKNYFTLCCVFVVENNPLAFSIRYNYPQHLIALEQIFYICILSFTNYYLYLCCQLLFFTRFT